MNSFGLGLILNFTDNASAGMRNATNTFQQMSATADSVASSVSNSTMSIVSASYALDSVGSTMLNAGSSIIGLYANISQSIIDTGLEMQGYRMQLRALYGDEAFEQKMSQIQEYAKDSVFEVQGLTQAVVTMKAVGIEAMNAVTSSSGQTTQTLMDYASDIAAMFPNMRNAYGTGVNAAMGALKEYIAEGNALSLKRGAGLDITGLLGEDKGTSIEERTRQVADLVEQLGIAGYTTSLMGTPTQQLSRMQDILFNTMSKISDSGVLERYTTLLTTVADWMDNLYEDTERYEAIVSILGDTVTSVLTPLQSFVDKAIEIADAVINWAIENPKLTKNILLTVVAVGGFLVAGGLLLKLISSIGMASAGFDFLKKLPSLLSVAGGGFKLLLTKALPFVALAGLAYYAWTENLFGIRDTITGAVEDITAVFSLISDAWKDNTLSQENYDLAESLGILPLIESLLMFKYYWGYFVDGFKAGFDEFFKSLEETLGVFGIDVSDTFAKVGEFLRTLFDIGQEDKWTNIGETVGKLAGIAVSLLAIFKVLSLFKSITGLFKGGLPFFGGKSKEPKSGSKPFDGIINVFSSLAKSKPATVLKGMLNLAIILGGLTLIAGAIMAVSPYLAGLTDLQSFLEVSIALLVLGVVGTALAKLSQIVGKISVGTVAKGLANMAIMIGGMAALFAIIGLVSMIPVDTAKVFEIVVIIGILGVLGAVLALFAAIVGLLPVPIVALGLANMAIIIGGLALLYMAIGAITLLGFNPSSILEIIEVIGVLGTLGSILSVFAGIVGLIPIPVVLAGIANIILVVGALTELAVAVSESLPQIGENISKFAESVEPALDILSSFEDVNFDSIGDFFTSFGKFMLQLAGDKIVSIFTGGTDLTKVANQLVDFATVSKEAFISFSGISAGSINGLVRTVEAIETLAGSDITSLAKNKTLSNLGEEFKTFADSFVNSFDAQSAQVMTSFIEKGKNIGSNLMQSIASSITANAYRIRNALQGVVSSLSVNVNPSVVVPSGSPKPQGMLGLSTGGYVKETGVAVLHPNEVVVNDELTQGLRTFLNQQNSISTSRGSNSQSQGGQVNNDYSVKFEAGSIVIQLANATESELEKVADKLMKIIERKQQLKAMAVRA